MAKKKQAGLSNRELGRMHFELMVHRFLYYVFAEPVISDHQYDALERAFTTGGGFVGVGSDNASDYHPLVAKEAGRLLKDEAWRSAYLARFATNS